MDKALRAIQRQMRQQQRGRMWRPPKELREAIVAWAAAARGRGQTWREISAAVLVEKHRIKGWQKAARRRELASPATMLPVHISRESSPMLTAVVVRGLGIDDIVTLMASL